MTTLSSLLAQVQSGNNLSESQAQGAVTEMMQPHASAGEVKSFLLALKAKGESLSEVVGAARAMRKQALTIKTTQPVLVDTCGTGGDGLGTANISTLAALVVAGAGVPVAKHGNRGVTSACGSADFLEALGVAVDVEPVVVEQCLEQTHFCFLFAPRFHPAMKTVASIRKELGVPTIFNLLGPLTNPAGVQHQVVGVADANKMDLYAQALRALGTVRALVVHGADGQDEISTTGASDIVEINTKRDPDQMIRYSVFPEAFGIRTATLAQLRGGSPKENGKLAQNVLAGTPGALRDAVVLNAAAALYVAGAVVDIQGGVVRAAQAIDRGNAKNLLEQLKKITHSGGAG